MSSYSLAVDIGGTFTDAVLLSVDGRSFVEKTLTTHQDLLAGFFGAVDSVLAAAGLSPGDVDDVVVHATTVVTNALIERKGPKTGLILTKGFRDILYIRDEHRYDMYDPQIEFAEPLVPSEQTFVVDERIYADATVLRGVDEAEVRAIAERCREDGIASVAVCLLNSYRNPANELAVRRVFEAEAPDIFVSLSSDVAPQMREYLRASTVAINAYTEPITRPYLGALVERLKSRGYQQQPLIMLSNGGVVAAERAARYPVKMIESGPAAGALVASFFARKFDLPSLISFDMGGTTAKACFIQQYEPLVTGSFEVDRRYRFKPGSGMPVTVPSIDLVEIGAGGGSIARIDALGLLKSGPDSAGSDPGPACYGRGGQSPCVTDADVVLGIIDPERFLGGDMKLDSAAAHAALARLGEQGGFAAEQAAWGVFEVVCEQMASAVRAHATERGIDYRGLPMLAFGGAGPVHACMVAELIESATVIYPPLASVLSAFGTLVTPARVELVRSHVVTLDGIQWDAVSQTLSALAADGRDALIEAGLAVSDISYQFAADVRYLGQQSELRIVFDEDPRKRRDSAAIGSRFETEYVAQYGLKLDGMSIEVVNWRVTATGPTRDRTASSNPAGHAAPRESRPVFMRGSAVQVPVYQRQAFWPDGPVAGPIIVEERETTIFVLPGWAVETHGAGSLIAKRSGKGS
ncbi:MAG TPA: hydantoinase/oxoprolinase family protein [Aestuariivirgaceae bacterium]|nr:hydantoinase/oxoprolinase family protein [Aestuariivirgaceae bacterium]